MQIKDLFCGVIDWKNVGVNWSQLCQQCMCVWWETAHAQRGMGIFIPIHASLAIHHKRDENGILHFSFLRNFFPLKPIIQIMEILTPDGVSKILIYHENPSSKLASRGTTLSWLPFWHGLNVTNQFHTFSLHGPNSEALQDSLTYSFLGLSAWFSLCQPSCQVSFQPSVGIIQPIVCRVAHIQPYCVSDCIDIGFTILTFQPCRASKMLIQSYFEPVICQNTYLLSHLTLLWDM